MFSWQITVLDTVTKFQIDLQQLLLRNFSSSNSNHIWNTLDQRDFKNSANHFTEQEILTFLIKDENFQPFCIFYFKLTLISADNWNMYLFWLPEHEQFQ